MKNKLASTTSLRLVPDYDEFYDQGLIPQEPSIQPVYCFKKCEVVTGVCKCTLDNYTRPDIESIRNALKDHAVNFADTQQSSKKDEADQNPQVKGADEKKRGVLKKKSYKGASEQQSRHMKKIQFDIPREMKALKSAPKSSLLNSILQCFLNSKGLEFNQKEFGSKPLPFNSFNQLKQLKDSYGSPDSSPVSAERINAIIQGKRQYKDCYQFMVKMLEKLISDNKSYEKYNGGKEREKQVLGVKGRVAVTPPSFLEGMLQVETQKVTSCSKCKFSSAKPLLENVLTLNVLKQKQIRSIIQHQFEKKPVPDKCSSCFATSRLTVTQHFTKAPSFLIIALKYESKDRGIEPTPQLILPVHDQKIPYQLHSMIATSDFHDYYSIIQNLTTREWYIFGEQRIISVGKKEKWGDIIKEDSVVFANYQMVQGRGTGRGTGNGESREK